MSSADDDETQRRQEEIFGDDDDDLADFQQDAAAPSSSGDEEQERGKAGRLKKSRKRGRNVSEEETRQRAADEQFIEDDIAQDGSEDDDENQHGGVVHEEAIEEDNTIASITAGKRKKVQADPDHVDRIVETFCRQMEVAAEMDMTDHEEGKMAMAKIRMIPQVEKFCSNHIYRSVLIKHRVTSGMKAWLAPYMDGTLPHVRVRTAILKALEKMDLDTADDEHRSMLKETDIGKYVQFLSRLSDETTENRRLASQIVQKWTKPLLSQQHDEQARRQRDEARYRERKPRQAEEPSSAGKAAPRPGDPEYRIHASIPQVSKLDYVNMPESYVEEKQGAAPDKHDPLNKRIREITRKTKGGSDRAMKPSVEGRGIFR